MSPFKNFSMLKTREIIIFIAGLILPFSSFATQITNEYTITSTALNEGPNTWTFSYSVTNNNQGAGIYIGFDGFAILVPDSANVVSSVVPASYAPGGNWQFLENAPVPDNNVVPFASALETGAIPPTGYHWDTWWGFEPQSVYPVGTTATFGVTLSNVAVGAGIAPVVTYLGYPNFAIFTTTVAVPTAVPIPSALIFALSELAVVGLVACRRRAASKKTVVGL